MCGVGMSAIRGCGAQHRLSELILSHTINGFSRPVMPGSLFCFLGFKFTFKQILTQHGYTLYLYEQHSLLYLRVRLVVFGLLFCLVDP